ncbi:MAG: hypothetical protein JNK80_04645 [Dechloromonas sp.]|nr:hypothetical protein [Dechloromonas sp.]
MDTASWRCPLSRRRVRVRRRGSIRHNGVLRVRAGEKPAAIALPHARQDGAERAVSQPFGDESR